MNPTTMLGVMRNPDVPVLQACSEVFNDWMAEFASYDPQRLVGVSVIPMHDVDWAVGELNRTHEPGPQGAYDQLPGSRGLSAIPGSGL